jgi:hypothetical protein
MPCTRRAAERNPVARLVDAGLVAAAMVALVLLALLVLIFGPF